MYPMHPFLLETLVRERILEDHRVAEHHVLAKAARRHSAKDAPLVSRFWRLVRRLAVAEAADSER